MGGDLRVSPFFYLNKNKKMKTFQQFMVEATPFAVIGPTSSYGPGLYGNKTASGQVLTPTTPGIAHRTLPLGSDVRLTDPRTKKSVTTKVIDRGPYVGDRQADLTTQTTRDLGFRDYKQYGVRDIDVTPVSRKPAQPKIGQVKGKRPIVGLPD
jgi:rare lipoprotein A (peptidoglycan hydrolase)